MNKPLFSLRDAGPESLHPMLCHTIVSGSSEDDALLELEESESDSATSRALLSGAY